MTPNNNLLRTKTQFRRFLRFYLFFKKSVRGLHSGLLPAVLTWFSRVRAKSGTLHSQGLSVLLIETVAKTRSTKPNDNGEFLLQQTVFNFQRFNCRLGHLIDFFVVFDLKNAGATQQHSRMLEVPAVVAG
jgi:hypothetical protein